MRQPWTATLVFSCWLTREPSVRAFLAYTPHVAARKPYSYTPSSTAVATTSQTETAHSDTAVAATTTAADEVQRIPGGELLSLGLDDLGERMGGTGRAKMIWSSIASGVDPFSEKGSIEFLTPRTAKQLQAIAERLPWQVVQQSVSACGTRKLLVRLEDGLEVETVVIPCLSGTRSTVCVSSQIGCAENCQFCMTGKMGLVRNLTAGEILGQVFFALETVGQHDMVSYDTLAGRLTCHDNPSLTNVVYMGMGEPLDNPVAVRQSLELLTHPHAFAMAKSKISVSTVGPSPAAIRRMKDMPSRLAWSVHAATDEIRRLLVPTTVHTMAELRDAFVEVFQSRRREHLFVEVVLMDGINDSPELARELALLLRPLPSKASINLLPYNDTGHAIFRTSTPEAVNEFQRILTEEGYVATIRTARGTKKLCMRAAGHVSHERADVEEAKSK